jgi:hypothetical protein
MEEDSSNEQLMLSHNEINENGEAMRTSNLGGTGTGASTLSIKAHVN